MKTCRECKLKKPHISYKSTVYSKICVTCAECRKQQKVKRIRKHGVHIPRCSFQYCPKCGQKNHSSAHSRGNRSQKDFKTVRKICNLCHFSEKKRKLLAKMKRKQEPAPNPRDSDYDENEDLSS